MRSRRHGQLRRGQPKQGLPRWGVGRRAPLNLLFCVLSLTLLLAACRGSRLIGGAGNYAVLGATNIRPPITLPEEEPSAKELHKQLFEEDKYPSARACGRCHPGHYEEWSVSPHAYAQLSPVFNAMQGSIIKLTNGTFGDFCIRCHTPVGMDRNEPFFQSNLYRHPASREGITCIACHRPKGAYGKISARSSPERGDIFAKMLGPRGGEILEDVLEDKTGRYGALASSPDDETGSKIHAEVERFFYLTRPGFCGTCHDVTLGDGFRLEEAFSDYKASPAARRGVTCQDCHMGALPGKESGYRCEPAACVNRKPTQPRKRTDHMFAGPDYSIVHPGLFPHLNEEDSKLANMTQWLQFDYKAGWGTDEFEEKLFELEEEDQPPFPEHWQDIDTRLEARAILNKQFRLLSKYREAQLAVLREGYKVGRIQVESCGPGGLAFRVQVYNGTDGHNVPTGFIAERNVFLEVTVTDREGTVVFQSGDVDPNGDVRDNHSLYVHDGLVPEDKQLFSLQSHFLVRLLRGGERGQVLAINHSLDPLPFLRPETRSTIWHGQPYGARIHRTNIEPCGQRWAHYSVPACNLTGKAPYYGRVRLISGMVPVNLINAIKDVGFDYGLTAHEVAKRVVEGRMVLWDRAFPIQGAR